MKSLVWKYSWHLTEKNKRHYVDEIGEFWREFIQAAMSIPLIFPEHPLRNSPVCSQRMYYLLIFANIPTWCCGNITKQCRGNIRSWYCKNISCANFVNVPNEHTRNVLRVFATCIRKLCTTSIKWEARCSMMLLLCRFNITITRFITVNLIFTIYLTIMATCQELVELGQTPF